MFKTIERIAGRLCSMFALSTSVQEVSKPHPMLLAGQPYMDELRKTSHWPEIQNLINSGDLNGLSEKLDHPDIVAIREATLGDDFNGFLSSLQANINEIAQKSMDDCHDNKSILVATSVTFPAYTRIN